MRYVETSHIKIADVEAKLEGANQLIDDYIFDVGLQDKEGHDALWHARRSDRPGSDKEEHRKVDEAVIRLLDEGRRTAQEINLPQLQKTLANGGITIHMDDKFLSMRSEKKLNTDPKKSSASIKTDTLSYH